MKIGVFIVAHDGLQSVLTGVGVVVNSFIESFNILKKKTELFKKCDIELNCIAPYIQKNSKDYHKNIKEKTEDICIKNKGKFIEISTLSDGSSQQSIWGDVSQWEQASSNAAIEIKSFKEKYDKIYIFGHDTIFCLIRYYLGDMDNTTFIWIPHSLGKIFYENKIDSKRVNLEIRGIKAILNSKSDMVGCIGRYFREVLLENYKVPESKLISLENGLYTRSSRFILTKNEKERLNSKYHFPKDKKWIFSWGRCSEQKGFDFILKTLVKFPELLADKHLILLMPDETSSEKYLQEINGLLIKLPKGSFTKIFKFDSKLPNFILRNENTETIIFASRFEGNPLAPIEALSFNKEAKIVFSNISPFNNIFWQSKRYFRFDFDYYSLRNALKQKVNKDHKKLRIKEIWQNYAKGLSQLNRKP